jgi:hypothetical protein
MNTRGTYLILVAFAAAALVIAYTAGCSTATTGGTGDTGGGGTASQNLIFGESKCATMATANRDAGAAGIATRYFQGIVWDSGGCEAAPDGECGVGASCDDTTIHVDTVNKTITVTGTVDFYNEQFGDWHMTDVTVTAGNFWWTVPESWWGAFDDQGNVKDPSNSYFSLMRYLDSLGLSSPDFQDTQVYEWDDLATKWGTTPPTLDHTFAGWSPPALTFHIPFIANEGQTHPADRPVLEFRASYTDDQDLLAAVASIVLLNFDLDHVCWTDLWWDREAAPIDAFAWADGVTGALDGSDWRPEIDLSQADSSDGDHTATFTLKTSATDEPGTGGTAEVAYTVAGGVYTVTSIELTAATGRAFTDSHVDISANHLTSDDPADFALTHEPTASVSSDSFATAELAGLTGPYLAIHVGEFIYQN